MKKKTRKILFLVETDSMTGSGKCALELIQQFHHNNIHDIIVVTQHKNDINAYCNQNSIENYNIHFPLVHSKGENFIAKAIAIAARPVLNFMALRELKKKVDFSSIAIVHSNTSALDFGAYLNKKIGIPHIWHFREFSAFNGAFNMIVPDFIHYADKFSTKIITVSKILSDFLCELGISPNKIEAIYDGIPLYQTTERKIVQQKNLKIVCVGHIYKQKGQDAIIKAISLLSNNIKDKIHCDFYGPWEKRYKNEIDRLIQEKGLQKNITFLGPATNIPAILNKYDIGIQPSHAEGFSRVTVEYMQSKLCVIAAREGAIPELIENQANGLLYTDYHYDELAQLIEKCFHNRELITQLGYQAHIDAINKFCIEKNFINIFNVYEKIHPSKNSSSD